MHEPDVVVLTTDTVVPQPDGTPLLLRAGTRVMVLHGHSITAVVPLCITPGVVADWLASDAATPLRPSDDATRAALARRLRAS